MKAKLASIAKALVPIVLSVVYAVQAAISDGEVTDDEKRAILGLVVTALLVYLVPNKKAPEA